MTSYVTRKTPGDTAWFTRDRFGMFIHWGLYAFPGIFKGEHVRRTDMVEIRTGRRIVVEFNRPTPLQIDGETVTDVRKYAVTAAVPAVREQIA